MTDASLVDVRKFFEMPTKQFAEEWKTLSAEDKAYFKSAVGELNK